MKKKYPSYSEPILGVMNYPTENIDKACKNIVVSLDTGSFEWRRENRSRTKEMFEKLKKE